MNRTIFACVVGLSAVAVSPSFAAGMGSMQTGAKPAAMAATGDYRFELAGPPQSTGGKSIVSVKLLHDGKPVTGAIIIQSRADMGPIGMAAMTAPVKPLGEQPPGTYRFEVENGPVWKKPENWPLHVSAKVQGVARTVTGKVIVELAP